MARSPVSNSPLAACRPRPPVKSSSRSTPPESTSAMCWMHWGLFPSTQVRWGESCRAGCWPWGRGCPGSSRMTAWSGSPRGPSPRANVPAVLLAPQPDALSAVQAATIPVAFLTAELAFQLADLQPGERVLIHAASGGVGLAAIQLARSRGAEVFATASPAKQDFLRALGIDHVYNSRTTDFAGQIIRDTGGAGLSVVLDSLTSEGFIEATLSALAPGGRFVEIGKREIWSAERMSQLRPDVEYRILAVDRLAVESPQAVGDLLRGLLERFAAGQLQPLPATVFPLAQAPPPSATCSRPGTSASSC